MNSGTITYQSTLCISLLAVSMAIVAEPPLPTTTNTEASAAATVPTSPTVPPTPSAEADIKAVLSQVESSANTATAPAAVPKVPVSQPESLPPAPTEQPTPPVETPPANPVEAPQPVAEVNSPVVQEQKQPEEEPTIDTLDIQEGNNWLVMRKILESMIDMMEDINSLFSQILEIRTKYLEKRNQVDREFDIFANKSGFELGDLNQLIEDVTAGLEQERTRKVELTEQERMALSRLHEKQEELKQLQATISGLTDLDAAIDDIVMTAERQVQVVRSHEDQIWKNFQEIKKGLSDEQAEQLHYQTEAMLKNVKEIKEYLEGGLFNYFEDTLNTLQESIKKTQAVLEGFSKENIDLRAETAKLLAGPQAAPAQCPTVTPVKERGFLSKIVHYPLDLLSSFWDYIMSFFGAPETAKLLHGADKAVPAATEAAQ
jgi:hypothetical protein